MKSKVLKGHTRPIKYIEFDSNSGEVYSASNDRTIICWDVEKAEQKKVLLHAAAVNCFSISKCGKYLVSGDATGILYFWDIIAKNIIFYAKGDPTLCIKSIFINKSVDTLLLTLSGRLKSSNSYVKIYDFKKLLENTKNTVKVESLKTNDDYSNQSIYNSTNKKGNSFKEKENLNSDYKNTNIVFNFEDLIPTNEITAKVSKFVKSQYILSDKYIIASKEDGFIDLYNSNSLDILIEKKIHNEYILDYDVDEELQILITSSTDGFCTLTNLNSFDTITKFNPTPTRNINCCRLVTVNNPFLTQKKIDVDDLFSSSENNELLEDKYIKIRKLEKISLAIYSGGQDSKLVTTTHQNEGGFEIIINEVTTGIEILNFKSHFGPVNALGSDNSNGLFASGSEDAIIKLYELNNLISSTEGDKPN
jgi:WD40 repeat protein